jgi:hypothetical protein
MDDDNFTDLIGLTIDEAAPIAAERGINELRVMAADGEFFFGTCDFCMDRLDIGLMEGRISEIMGIG